MIDQFCSGNPDFHLVLFNANKGFQSKMSTETGSYVIEQIVNSIDKNLQELQ